MLKRAYQQKQRRFARLQARCRHLWSHAVGWAILSYAFVSVYGALYGPHPAIIHRLGTTLAVLCGGGGLVFAVLFVVWKLTAALTAWQYRRERQGGNYGAE